MLLPTSRGSHVSPHFYLVESIDCAQTTASEPILSGLTGPIGRAEIEDRRPRRKRSATPQVAAAQPIVLPAKNEGMLERFDGNARAARRNIQKTIFLGEK